VVIIINPEVKSDTNELYLTFKLLKRRYRSSEEDERLRRLEYFNHPFEHDNGIRLIDDIEFDKPLSLESLSTKFEAVDNKRGKTNAVERETKETNTKEVQPKKNSSFDEEFEPFDFDKASNF
jgi:hypothetical protein